MRKILSALLLIAVVLLSPSAVHAQTPNKNKGLTIAPIRQYVAANAGQPKNGSFTVANFSEHPSQIQLSVSGFSVSDYAYDYKFSAPENDWLKLSQTIVELRPNETKSIPFSIIVPSGSSPGGQYYTVFATSAIGPEGSQQKVRVAMLVYLTVNGKLVQTTNLQDSRIKTVVLGSQIPLQLDIKNTGNVHFFTHTSASLHGLFARPNSITSTYLLLPNKIRRIETDLSSPFLPGFYRINYGYRTDAGFAVQRSKVILYIPPWSIVVLLFIAWAIFRTRKKLKN